MALVDRVGRVRAWAHAADGEGLADTIQRDGHDNDGKPGFDPAADVQPTQRGQDVIAQPPPAPPIIEAMITMFKVSMITWFTPPTINEGRAVGTMTFHIC